VVVMTGAYGPGSATRAVRNSPGAGYAPAMGMVEIIYHITKKEAGGVPDEVLTRRYRNQATSDLKAQANAAGDLIVHGTLTETIEDGESGAKVLHFEMQSR
jgi:hypothetical protein